MACAAVAATLGWRLVSDWRRPPPLPPPAIRLLLSPPPGTTLGAGDEPLDAAISADSSELVYVATDNGISQLWHRSLARDVARPLDGTAGALWPAWIPGARAISFFADGELRRAAVADGDSPTTRVETVTPTPGAAGAAWTSDGAVLIGHLTGPVTRWQNGTQAQATTLQPGDIGHRFPAVVDGGAWLYLAERADGRKVVRVVRDGTERDVTAADGHAQVVAGWLLYARGGALLAQRYDPATGATTGRAEAVVTGVGVSSVGRTRVAAAARLLLTGPAGGRRQVVRRLDQDGEAQETVSEPGNYWQVRVSPDGSRLAVTMEEPLLRTLDIYVLSEGSGSPQPVTLGLAADSDPVWSPDGRTLLFRSMRNGEPRLYTRLVGVTGAPEAPLPGTDALRGVPSDWTRGSESVVLSAPVASAAGTPVSTVLSIDPRTGLNTTVKGSGFSETDARVSPDGRWVAYVSDESGQPDVYVSRWHAATAGDATGAPRDPAGRLRVSQAGGMRPRWLGSSVLFERGDGEILRADRSPTADAFSVPRLLTRIPGLRDFDVVSHTRSFVAIVPAPDAVPPSVTALVDWQSAVPQAAAGLP